MTKSRDVMDAYVGAWNTDDPAERRRLVQRALTEDAVVAYPNLSAEGQEEIAAAIGGLHEQLPGVHFVPTSGIEEHHGWLRATWAHARGRRLDPIGWRRCGRDLRGRTVQPSHWLS